MVKIHITAEQRKKLEEFIGKVAQPWSSNDQPMWGGKDQAGPVIDLSPVVVDGRTVWR